MPSTFRVPKARLTGLYGRTLAGYARRVYGQIPDNAFVLWHHQPALRAVLGVERRVARFDRLDPHLKSFAVMASAASGCSWCLDFDTESRDFVIAGSSRQPGQATCRA